jgi:hypothetical protein
LNELQLQLVTVKRTNKELEEWRLPLNKYDTILLQEDLRVNKLEDHNRQVGVSHGKNIVLLRAKLTNAEEQMQQNDSPD